MDTLLYKIIRPILSFFFKIIYRPTIIGTKNLTNDYSMILAGNHTSKLDWWLLMSTTKRQIHFLAKDTLFQGIFGGIFRSMGLIPVNRKTHDHAALEKAYSYLRNNKVIGLFPEGTINRSSDTILPFKIGAIKMSNETSSPIIPFTIKGKYKPFRKTLTIEFYEKIIVGSKNLEIANNNFMSYIKNKLEEGEEIL